MPGERGGVAEQGGNPQRCNRIRNPLAGWRVRSEPRHAEPATLSAAVVTRRRPALARPGRAEAAPRHSRCARGGAPHRAGTERASWLEVGRFLPQQWPAVSAPQPRAALPSSPGRQRTQRQRLGLGHARRPRGAVLAHVAGGAQAGDRRSVHRGCQVSSETLSESLGASKRCRGCDGSPVARWWPLGKSRRSDARRSASLSLSQVGEECENLAGAAGRGTKRKPPRATDGLLIFADQRPPCCPPRIPPATNAQRTGRISALRRWPALVCPGGLVADKVHTLLSRAEVFQRRISAAPVGRRVVCRAGGAWAASRPGFMGPWADKSATTAQGLPRICHRRAAEARRRSDPGSGML